MKKYNCTVETTANEKYECLLDSKYALQAAQEEITKSKPDAMVMFGSDLTLRAGDVKAAYITGETEVE